MPVRPGGCWVAGSEQTMRFRIIFVVLVLSITFSPFSALSSDHVIRLVTQREGDALTESGLPFVHCAMKKTNRAYEIDRVPWERAQRDTKAGLYDGFFMAAKNSERDVYATWSNPFVAIKWLSVTRREADVSPEHMSHLQFAANLGSARLAWLEEQHKEGKLTREAFAVETSNQAMKMLTSGRVDVALMNNFDLVKAIKRLSIDPLTLKTIVNREKGTAVYFNKVFLDANADFLDEFNATLTSCQEELK